MKYEASKDLFWHYLMLLFLGGLIGILLTGCTPTEIKITEVIAEDVAEEVVEKEIEGNRK